MNAWVLAGASACAGAVVVGPGPCRAGQPVAGVRDDERALNVPTVGREDLARAYLRFERALRERPLAGEDVARVNDAFDALTQRFFVLDFGGAIERLEALIDRVEGRAAPADGPGGERVARAVIVRAEPPVVTAGKRVRLALGAVFRVEGLPEGGAAVEIVLTHAGGAQRVVREVRLGACVPGEVLGAAEINTEEARMLSGAWSIGVRQTGGGDAAGPAREVGRLIVMPKGSGSLTTIRAAVEGVLDAATERHPGLTLAIAAARSRAGVLTDRPSATRSAEFLFDLAALADAVEAEAGVILGGRDPYRGRAGDWWCEAPMTGGGGGGSGGTRGAGVPMRVYAPARLAAGAEPAALVIALHGAGGDEQMFMDAYGAGELKRLADERGFIAVSAQTGRGGTPAGFDAVVKAVSTWYAIDPVRVYVVGHSMGAMATAGLAERRRERIAATACIAGGGGGGGGGGGPMGGGGGAAAARPVAPMLVITAERDGIVPAGRLRQPREGRDTDRGPVEYRLARGWGHTLVVGATLPEAVDWLLARRLDDAKPAADGEGR